MKIEYLNKEYNLPDFLIVGAAKSGTTSLHYYLKQISNVSVPEIKESYFFSFFNNQPNFISPDPLFDVISNLDTYANQFKSEPESNLIGDASPSYLYSYQTTIDNIKQIYGERYKDLKIIILLRNPIDRAWSQYMHFKKNYNEPLEFREAIKKETIKNRLNNNWNYFYDYIGFGEYTNQVNAYLNNFKNVKIFLYDDLKNDSNEVLNQTLSFLEVDKVYQNNRDSETKVFNISGVPKKNVYSLFWRLKKIKGVKSVLRTILPAQLRNNLNNFLMSKSLKRTSISIDDKLILDKIYQNEMNTLYDLIKRDEIKNW